MTTIDHLDKASSTIMVRPSNQLSRQPHEATKVYIRLMFLRIGEIDTLNEKYQAQLTIEARWSVEFDKLSDNLSTDGQKRLTEGKSVSLHKYTESHWHPHLYIENALGDLKEFIRYSAKKSKYDNEIYVCEHRDIKGVFWEKLELQNFPADIQDLSISVASTLHDDKVVLYADPYLLSGVNLETFVDQQEWLLYKHVDIGQTYLTEFLPQGSNAVEEEDEEVDEDRKRSILTVTCHAARHSTYFYWNGYFLIFLIGIVSLSIFGIPPNLGGNRILTTCTLLLTSITFRWTVNRSLPMISYLTSLDIYAIICIFVLVIQTIWHAAIGSVIFYTTRDNILKPNMWFVSLDHYVFFAIISIFAIMHILIIIWLYMVPYKHRLEMAEKDKHYQLSVSKRKKCRNKEDFKKILHRLSIHSRVEGSRR